ncbi:hypothetical protein JD844_021026 [Phrynosoma platyrhinos]|uniref:EGF-like domain-containing protein n=1 Tax=Phrynosoma platyrhinos TaxID=52577 RepID=A0ABQ7SSX0_PHRPL|nr:hypothetical protein JD844_021026 [Phrynosoma platyrhinos]
MFSLVPDIDECEKNPCDGKGHCNNNEGSYSCLCFSGYTLLISQNTQTCQDHFEFSACDFLNDKGGQAVARTVVIKWKGRETHFCVLTDLNECDQPNVCHGGQCINTPGSYHCECKIGYIMDHRGQCKGECPIKNLVLFEELMLM